MAELRIDVAKLRMCAVEFGTVVAMLSASKLRRQLPISITRILQNCSLTSFPTNFYPVKKKKIIGSPNTLGTALPLRLLFSEITGQKITR